MLAIVLFLQPLFTAGATPWQQTPAAPNTLATLEASTLLGGNTEDRIADMAVGPDGSVYVSGSSASSAFPTTPGAYQTTSNGFNTIFVSRLSTDLTTLQVSTLLGGFEQLSPSEGFDLVLSGDRVYVTGETFADDFPTTPDASDRILDGANAAVVSVFDRDLSTLHFSTLLDGITGPRPEEDQGRAIAVTTDGTIYAAGQTISSTFPTTPGAFQETLRGDFDGFVARLSPGGAPAELTISVEPVHLPIILPPQGVFSTIPLRSPTSPPRHGPSICGSSSPAPASTARGCLAHAPSRPGRSSAAPLNRRSPPVSRRGPTPIPATSALI